nr:hypothetical protein 19 [bacterium]
MTEQELDILGANCKLCLYFKEAFDRPASVNCQRRGNVELNWQNFRYGICPNIKLKDAEFYNYFEEENLLN